ncbi:hypothetical protein BJY04DRAFT_229287 [Aspergillus karnatakaensis]|uniref:uncharacterized protein n=1 Tax=Aspergillus karnatakaensis TaxID=1810916 RepID=UPI003CCD5E10
MGSQPQDQPSLQTLTATILSNASSHPKPRYLIAIAGAPGSGKTTLATALAASLNTSPELQLHGKGKAIVLSMDGFHLPRSTLDKLPPKEREEAYVRRGAPWTFDVGAFLQFMRGLRTWADRTPPRQEHDGGDVLLAPTFSHATKDPLPDSLAITPDSSIIIIEGNYLLLDEDGWRDIASLVDYRVFVDVDLAIARERLARRHVEAGIEPTLEDGYRRVDLNDGINGVLVREKLVGGIDGGVVDLVETNPSFVLRAVKDVAFEDRSVTPLKDPWDVRVQIAQTGICGSDVHYWQRGRIGDFILESPIVLGHESSGIVTEVGSAVKNLKVGQKVAIEPGVPCRHCDYCRSGSYNLCPDTVFAATPPHDGTLSKYYTTQADYCYPLPYHMDLEEGAMVEPVAVAVQITKVGNVRANQTVVVFGCGPIGLLCQAVSKAYAAKKVIGIDISQSRLDFASAFGADGVFLPPKKPEGVEEEVWSEKLAALIKEKFNLGEGPDVVLEATGAQSCIQTGIHLTKKGGTYVQAGMGKENVVFPITTACIRDLTIRGSIRYSTGCYPVAVDLIASGKIDVKRLITDRFVFEKAEDAFELVKQGKESVIKVVIQGYQDK